MPRPLLPRKAPPSEKTASVKSDCKKLWRKRREKHRDDSFIGVTSLDDSKFYLAPCFGTQAEDHPDCFGCHWDDLKAMPTLKKKDLIEVYGKDNVLFVVTPMKDGKPDFDGKSHQEMVAWINRMFGKKMNADNDILGWSIQRDAVGDFLRFSSGRNQGKFVPRASFLDHGGAEKSKFQDQLIVGQNISYDEARKMIMLGLDQAPNADLKGRLIIGRAGWYKAVDPREDRDMPRAWARWIENVLARELKLALVDPPEGKFERITTRLEAGSTKVRHFGYQAKEPKGRYFF